MVSIPASLLVSLLFAISMGAIALGVVCIMGYYPFRKKDGHDKEDKK